MSGGNTWTHSGVRDRSAGMLTTQEPTRHVIMEELRECGVHEELQDAALLIN